MSFENDFFTERTQFLVFGVCDSKLVFDILKRHNICVWSNIKQCQDVIEERSEISKVSFPRNRAELDINDGLVAYSGTQYGLGVVIGIDLKEDVIENKTLNQIREQLVQIMREHGAFVMPHDLNIMYGECKE